MSKQYSNMFTAKAAITEGDGSAPQTTSRFS